MTDKQYLEQIGKNVYRLRTKKGWTQSELADECGWEKATVYRIEKGRTNVTALTIRKLAKAFGVKPGEILRAVQ